MVFGTPSHAVAQAMLAEHQYGMFGLFLLKSRFDMLHPVVVIEGCSTGIHDISQISQLLFGK